MESYYVQNFGCRANQSDGAAIEAELEAAGLQRAASAVEADWVVLNTCTVTANADADARYAIRRLHRENPASRIVVTGCYAQRAAEEIARLDGVTTVVGNTHKQVIGALVQHACGASPVPGTAAAGFVPVELLGGISARPVAEVGAEVSEAQSRQLPKIVTGEIFQQTQILVAPTFAGNDRSRPNLKVQDGCDNRCSYCVIPFVRGASRSQAVGKVLVQINGLVAAGYREVVISGINLGRWGRDLDTNLRLTHLVQAILDQTPLERLRLSSIEPMDWEDDLIALIASSSRIARHAHLPLQSGSDTVLRRMHRKYRPWHYEEKVRKIRAAIPDAAVGADVMVGFPGETEAEFEETRALIERLPFTYLHVFTYSSREGTAATRRVAALGAGGETRQEASEGAPPAWSLRTADDDWKPVEPQIAAARSRTLRALIHDKQQQFLESFVGRALPVVTLAEGGAGAHMALSDNYLKVRLSAPQPAGQLLDARIIARDGDTLLAE